MSQPLSEWPVSLVADVALRCEDQLIAHGDNEVLAQRRNAMLDELVRRGVIESYTLIGGEEVEICADDLPPDPLRPDPNMQA